MTPIPDSTTPTFTLVSNYFFDYAARLLEFHNLMMAAEDAGDKDDIDKYALVLKFDGDLRATCAEMMPKCLSPRIPYDPKWPRWVAWARKLHQASVNHKIIMIHQNYLSKSFKDVRYTYTRWACATSAKNVINIYCTREPDEPQWWVEHAFLVTAGICLVLDLFHRADTDPEAQEYQSCVQKAITFLQQFFTSSVAVHGARLLMSLLQEYAKLQENPKANPVTPADKPVNSVPNFVADLILPDSVRAAQDLPMYPEVPSLNDDPTQFNFDIDALGFEDLMDYLPAEGSLNNQVLFDSMHTITHGQIW
jgi:transcription elongation factor SPT5